MASKRFRVSFGFCFLAMTTAGALLFTWTLWWIFVVGNAVPARRSFFAVQTGVPALILEASSAAGDDVFQYALPGGWPNVNSGLRIVAATAAVLASITFALVASVARAALARAYFAAVLAVIALFSLAALIVDAVSIAKTVRECNSHKCVTSVPEYVLLSGNICKCAPDGWFYLTLAVDILLGASAVACLVLTLTRSLRRYPQVRHVSSSSLATTDGPSDNAAVS